MKKLSLVVFVLVGLTSCAQYLKNNNDLSMRSRNGTKLVVPPPLTSDQISSYYDLPTQYQAAQISLAPPEDDIT